MTGPLYLKKMHMLLFWLKGLYFLRKGEVKSDLIAPRLRSNSATYSSFVFSSIFEPWCCSSTMIAWRLRAYTIGSDKQRCCASSATITWLYFRLSRPKDLLWTTDHIPGACYITFSPSRNTVLIFPIYERKHPYSRLLIFFWECYQWKMARNFWSSAVCR